MTKLGELSFVIRGYYVNSWLNEILAAGELHVGVALTVTQPFVENVFTS